MPIYTTKSSTIKRELLKHKLSSNASTHPAQDYFCTLHSSPVDGRDWHQVGLPTAIKHNYYYFFPMQHVNQTFIWRTDCFKKSR